MPVIVRHARVVTPGRDLGVTDVRIEGDRIVALGGSAPADCETIGADGLIALPGFIDIHSHGRGGADFCDATDAAFETIGRGKLADGVFAEIITDGVHLSDPMIRLIAKAKGPDRVMVITDAMCAAGEPDGIYSLGGLRVKVERGRATLADVPYDPKAVVSNVAGSVALYPQCFKRYVAATGLPLEEAVKATSYNPCVSLGIPDRGEISVGKIADLVLVDQELNPVMTIVNGEVAWKSDSLTTNN